MKYIPTNLCHIKEHGLYCFGCCGDDWLPKDQIEKGVRINTEDLKKHVGPIKEFRNRSWDLTEYGVCPNLVFLKDGSIGCHLHPKIHGEDLREGYCENDHLCKAAFMYNSFDDETKEKFVKFLISKKLDTYDYSIRMDNGELIAEFLEKIT